MKKLRYLWLAAAAMMTLGMTVCCQKPQNDINLRLNLEKGRTYTLRLSSEQVITQTPYNVPQRVRKLMSMGFLFNVQDFESKGDALMEVTVHSARIELDQGGERMKYDSSVDSPENISPQAQGIAAFIGEQFIARISPKGKVTQVDGVEEMMEHIVDKMNFSEGPEKEAAKESLRGEFGSRALKEMIENMLAIYPDEAVSVGESWSDVSNVSEGLPLVLKNTWTLKSSDKERAVIRIQSEGNPYGDRDNFPGEKFFYDLQGMQEGTFVLDGSSGWIVEASLTQRLWGRVILNGAEQIGEEASWPLEIESTTILGAVE